MTRAHERPTGLPRAVPLRVIIADGDAYARRTIRDALQDAGAVVIAEAATGVDAVQLSVHYLPDVVLVDVALPGMGGLTAARTLRDRAPQVKVLMLSAGDGDDVALACLRNGAAGFLSKSMDISSLPRALQAAHDGEAVVSRRLTARLILDMCETPLDGIGTRPVRSRLTPREWEVLDLLCQRASTLDIAETLFLSPETVRSHVKNVLRKLGVGSRQQAIEAARQLRAGTPRPLPAGPGLPAAA
jgi:NarL family two-component system response regulator LiaR